MTPSDALGGRTAFVTGAAGGLGLDIARGLVRAGARVMLADIDAAAVHQAAETLQREQAQFDDQARSTPLDVRDEAAFVAAFELAVAAWGGVDVMVNNAARSGGASLWDVSVAEWDETLAVNLRGCFFGCRIAARHMRARRAGRIINLASIAGQLASPGASVHYAASKAGILALTRSFAAELAADGVCVNAIAPSAIDSPALRAAPPSRQQALLAATPMGRFGTCDEVSAAVLYLASDGAGYVTGSTLDLNGGRLMR